MIRRRAPRGQGDRLRAEVLAAASALLAETGDEAAVSIRAVATRVGVTPPSIYLHFADKDDLLAAVCAEVFAEFDELLRIAAERANDPIEALERQGIAYVEFARTRPEHYRLMFMSRPRPGLEAPTKEELTALSGLSRVIAVVAAAQQQGLLPAEEPTAVAIRLWTSAHGIASLFIAKPHFPWGDTDRLVRRTLREMLLGVGVAGWGDSDGLAERLRALAATTSGSGSR